MLGVGVEREQATPKYDTNTVHVDDWRHSIVFCRLIGRQRVKLGAWITLIISQLSVEQVRYFMRAFDGELRQRLENKQNKQFVAKLVSKNKLFKKFESSQVWSHV